MTFPLCLCIRKSWLSSSSSSSCFYLVDDVVLLPLGKLGFLNDFAGPSEPGGLLPPLIHPAKVSRVDLTLQHVVIKTLNRVSADWIRQAHLLKDNREKKEEKKKEEKNELEKKKEGDFWLLFKKRENNVFPKWKNSRGILFLQRWCQILCVAWSPSHLPLVATRSVSSLFACFVIENKQAKKWIYFGNCFHCEEQDARNVKGNHRRDKWHCGQKKRHCPRIRQHCMR